MPLGLILFLSIYGSWVGLNTAADEAEVEHPYYCIDHYYDRVVWDVPGFKWLIPYPFRKGKSHIDFKEGDRDNCSGETYNGKWWYKK